MKVIKIIRVNKVPKPAKDLPVEIKGVVRPAKPGVLKPDSDLPPEAEGGVLVGGEKPTGEQPNISTSGEAKG